MRLLRNLAFYFAFYLGSLLITSASLAVLPFSVEAFRRQVRNWSQWQRWCLTHLLGCEIVLEGAPLAEPVQPAPHKSAASTQNSSHSTVQQ